MGSMSRLVLQWLLIQVVVFSGHDCRAQGAPSLVRAADGLQGLDSIRREKFPALLLVYPLHCIYKKDDPIAQKECKALDPVLELFAQATKGLLNVWTLSCSDHQDLCTHFGMTAGILRPFDPWILGWSQDKGTWTIEAYTGASKVEALVRWMRALVEMDQEPPLKHRQEVPEKQPDPAKFPQLFETGGVVLFLHVPKTGGTALRYTLMLAKLQAFFQALDKPRLDLVARSRTRLEYIFCENHVHFRESAVPWIQKMQEVNNNPIVLVVEVHGRTNPTAMELEPMIQTWRQQLEVPFFAFTLLRDPVAHQVSFFNYFLLPPSDERYEGLLEHGKEKAMEQKDGTCLSSSSQKQSPYWEQVLSHTPFSNPQCQFLAHGEKPIPPSQALDCQEVLRSLQRSMDWVGTTEKLSVEALPLLTGMIWNSPELGRSYQKRLSSASPSKTGHREEAFLLVSQLHATTRASLELKSPQDRDMYETVLRNYTLV